MKRELGFLAWLTFGFAGSSIVLQIIWVYTSNAAGGGLGWGILLGFFLLLALIVSSLTALALGITGCRAARQSRRWGWFGAFLSLTILVPIGVLVFFWGQSFSPDCRKNPSPCGATLDAGSRCFCLSP